MAFICFFVLTLIVIYVSAFQNRIYRAPSSSILFARRSSINMLQTSSFQSLYNFRSNILNFYSKNKNKPCKGESTYNTEHLDRRDGRFSFSLQAALSLRESIDVIKETVLLSEIVGHYVKDIQHKGKQKE